MTKLKASGKKGFTLIELMIVVAIIGILAAVAIPKFADLIRKSGEGATKGNLGAVRSALSIYYGDMEGTYPDDLGGLTIGGKYLGTLTEIRAPNYHPASNAVSEGALTALADADGWYYVDAATDPNLGNVLVSCLHTDTKNSVWTVY